jgi:DNA-binding GntR family transcriptional regulator
LKFFDYCILSTKKPLQKYIQMEILTLKECAVQYLRSLIAPLQLAPGQKLNEMELSAMIGISCPPLPEALRVLENEPLVVSIPRRG